ncbi:hypothetical protein CAL7102_10298 [Dulcicalothrix desertica PCC 7102]|nr:hypothetical protein CAL7102_10298 [Dulcicalothrix desertica PCC 7102]
MWRLLYNIFVLKKVVCNGYNGCNGWVIGNEQGFIFYESIESIIRYIRLLSVAGYLEEVLLPRGNGALTNPSSKSCW